MNEVAQGDSLGILRGVELWAGSIVGMRISERDGSRCKSGDCGKVSSKGKDPLTGMYSFESKQPFHP